MLRLAGPLVVALFAAACDNSQPAPPAAPSASASVAARTSGAPSSCITETSSKRTLCHEIVAGDLTEAGKEEQCQRDKGAFRHHGCTLEDSFGYCETTPGSSVKRTYWYGKGGESFRQGCEVGAGKFVATPAAEP